MGLPIIRIRRAVSVPGEGKRAFGYVPGGVVLEDSETGQVLRFDARPDVDHRIVVIVQLVQRAEVLEVLVQRVVELLALVERLELPGARVGADLRLAWLRHHVLDVDPEEVVDVHVPVHVAHDRVLEPEGDLAVPEVAVGEVQPWSWRDVPDEYDLQPGMDGRLCSEPHRANGRTYEVFLFYVPASPSP